MVIAWLIANLHVAVFYVFFILLMPYFAEYFIVLLRNAHLGHKIRVHDIKDKIRRLSKKENKEEKIAKLQAKLEKTEERFERFIANQKKREEKPYKLKIEKRDSVKWLVLVAILCFAMGLLTPIGDEPYTHIFKLMEGNTTQSISEHQPLVLYQHQGTIIVLVMLLGLLMFTDTKITLKDGFMLAGLLVLTFMSRRQFSLLLIVGVMSFTRLITEFVNKYDKGGTEAFAKLMVNWKGIIITVVLVVICSYCLYKPKMQEEYTGSNIYPVGVADFILKEVEEGRIDLNTMKIYNDYNYGSYLLYRGIPVFIDSRADLYSPQFNEGCEIFSDYINISNINVYYEDKFNDYGITHAIVYKNSKLNLFFPKDENYKELYSDDNFILYERLKINTKSDE